ncbi:MAG: hypothetical protein LQ350_005225 [Teloschistes chrysophthalmus]|nr:MAG: hypothetical protein LQ350_005225 [Niorma chrysophthalma]
MDMLNLPNEIIRLVVEHSRPDGFESLALTCKIIFAIAKPLIGEYNRSKPYLSTSLGLAMVSTMSCSRVFHNILRDPTMAQYPQHLRCYMWHLHDPQTYNLLNDSTFIDILETWIQASTYLEKATNDVDKIPKIPVDLEALQNLLLIMANSGSVVSLTSAPLLSSLLLLLPNLVEITISDMHPIVQHYLDGVMVYVAEDAIAGRKHPLSCLRTLYLSSVNDHVGISLESLLPFIALPSMRKIVGHLLELGRDDVPYRWPHSAHASNLEELHLNNSAIDDRDLKAFLQPMHKLRIFRHSHVAFKGDPSRFRRPIGHYWSAAHSMQQLLESIASTLEELSFTTNCPSAGALGFLRKLVHLKKVELDLRLLYEGDPSAALCLDSEYKQYTFSDESWPRYFEPSLGALLPTSIKEVVLMWDNVRPSWKELFYSFSKHRNERLRQLEKITFRSSFRGFAKSREIDEIVDELKSLGVQVIVEDVGDVDQIRPADHWEGDHYTDKGRFVNVWAEDPPPDSRYVRDSFQKVRPTKIASIQSFH